MQTQKPIASCFQTAVAAGGRGCASATKTRKI